MTESANFKEFMKALHRLHGQLVKFNRAMDRERAMRERQSRHSRKSKFKRSTTLVAGAQRLEAAAQKQLEITLARERELKKRDRLRLKAGSVRQRRSARGEN